MRGKYSPTVNAAYRRAADWFNKYSQGQHYDPEGYDSYGYDQHCMDRAGNHEFDYALNDTDSDYNSLYDDTLADWGFDGVKPASA